MEASVYNETYAMPADAGDDSRTGRLLAMLEEMMETAGRNAAKLGAGMRELHAKGLTWVLARLHVQVQAVPQAGQTIQIATWPAGRHRLFAVREFQVKDNAEREQLRATSAWAMMNKETRRLSRLDPLLPVFSRHPERMITDDFSPLPPLAQAGDPLSFHATAEDIDINDHVNNTVYLDWALHAVPDGTLQPGPLVMEAAFLGEARLGDEIICRSERALAGGKTIVRQSLYDAATGRELTRLRWTFGASAS